MAELETLIKSGESSHSSYDQLVQKGKTVSSEEIEFLCKSLYQTALDHCLCEEEKTKNAYT